MRPPEPCAQAFDRLIQLPELALEIGQAAVACGRRPAGRRLPLAVAAQHLELGADEEALPARLEQPRLRVGVHAAIIAERRRASRPRRSGLAWEALTAVSDTRVCPHCRRPTRAGWPLCDGCARTLPAERPLPDLRLVNELERWDRANPRPRDAAVLTRRTLKWLWVAVVVCSALDLRFGRHIGTGTSVWDTLAVGTIVLALLATLIGMFLLGLLSGRDPGATWRRERAQVRRRLGAGTPADP